MYIDHEPGHIPKNVADSMDVDNDASRRLRVIQHSEDKFEVSAEPRREGVPRRRRQREDVLLREAARGDDPVKTRLCGVVGIEQGPAGPRPHSRLSRSSSTSEQYVGQPC